MSIKFEELKNIIEYEGPFGCSTFDHQFWDDFEEELKEKIIRYKITNIKIYYNSKDKDQENYIVGIKFTFQNLSTGEKKEIEHKGTENIAGTRELVINPGEYVKKFHVNFKDDFTHISQIGFTTSKNRDITVGIKDGVEKTITHNNEDAILLGTYGYAKERLDGIGCLFIKRNIYLKMNLFGFFFVRYLIQKNEDFKKEWESKYKELDIKDQYFWKTMNLPDAAFASVIKYCAM